MAKIETTRANSREIKYAAFGSGGIPLVVIPGISLRCPLNYVSAMETTDWASLARDFTLFLIDRSRPLPSGTTTRDMARDTAAALRALGIADACVFGASQGGMIAQYLAIDNPGLVRRLAIGSSTARANATSNAVMESWIKLALSKDIPALAKNFLKLVYMESTARKIETGFIQDSLLATDEDLARFITQCKACTTHDALGELGKINCPIFAIGAADDKLFTAGATSELADAHGSECLIYPPPYSHAVYDEAPDYCRRLKAFFLGEKDNQPPFPTA